MDDQANLGTHPECWSREAALRVAIVDCRPGIDIASVASTFDNDSQFRDYNKPEKHEGNA